MWENSSASAGLRSGRRRDAGTGRWETRDGSQAPGRGRQEGGDGHQEAGGNSGEKASNLDKLLRALISN